MKLPQYLIFTLLFFANTVFASNENFRQQLLREYGGQSNCEYFLSRFFVSDAPTDREGCILSSVQLTNASLEIAISNGYFPWKDEDDYVYWCRPHSRGVLLLDNWRIPKTDQRTLKRLKERGLTVTTDRDFEGVIRGCARRTKVVDGARVPDTTWISPKIIDAYVEFAKAGKAHSKEVWDGDRLVGGLYWTEVRGVASGESMFFDPEYSGAGKLALEDFLNDARARGMKFVDIQQDPNTTEKPRNSVFYHWGASGIESSYYLKDLLRPAQLAAATERPDPKAPQKP